MDLDELPYNASSKIIRDQLIRSITSVGANIVEAKAAISIKDFINFYHYALKSCNESLFWLSLTKDLKYINYKKVSIHIQETQEICKILTVIILKMKNKLK